MKTKKTSTEQRPRRTWVGYKPRKEATKKERIERARNKYVGKCDQMDYDDHTAGKETHNG